MKRKYYVVAINKVGTYTWHSECGGFGLFDRVSQGLVLEWKEYADKESGQECTITNFMRLA